MRIVTLEEHITFKGLTTRIPKEVIEAHSLQGSTVMEQVAEKLNDITGERLASMDKNGVNVQVLSVAGPGADLLNRDEGPAFATLYNNMIALSIQEHKDRFAAFAHLPTTNPDEAAAELERTVKTYGFKGALINGLTDGKFLDNPEYAPILLKAQELDVPIYLHPGLPPKAVFEAYYNGLPKEAGNILSIAGWGWHSETAIHVLRLIVSGTLDKYPNLKLIIGHMGEMLPMMMARCNAIFAPGKTGENERSVIDTLKQQVHITTSGIFTQPPLVAALDTFGIDNILFSVDYPFSQNEQGVQFLKEIKLSDAEILQIASGNADKLLKLNATENVTT